MSLLLTGELLIDLGQPPLQAALFLQEVLVQLHKLSFTEHTGNLIQVQVFQGHAPLLQLGTQGLLLLQQGLPVVVLWWRELQFLQMVVRPDVVPDALGNQFYQPVQPNGVAGTQLLCPAVGIELTAQIIHPFFPLFPIGGLAHGAAAVHTLHKARQGVHHAGAVLPGADVQIPLDGLKGLPVDDGLVSALHPEPAVPGHDDNGLGFVAGLFGPALHHDAGVDLITEDPPYGVLVPEPEILLAEVVAVPAPLRLIPGGINHPQIVEHVGDTLLAVALQGPAEDLPHYLCRLRVH